MLLFVILREKRPKTYFFVERDAMRSLLKAYLSPSYNNTEIRFLFEKMMLFVLLGA
jgi:hypothetical protein